MGWSTTIATESPPLTIYERSDRDGALYLRWAEGDSHRRPRLQGLETVRDKEGKPDTDLVEEARRLALEQYREARAAHLSASEAVEQDQPLTLKAGCDLVLAVPGGKYATETQEHGDMHRALDRVCEILGDAFLWRDLKPHHYETVWRTFARRTKAGEWDLGPRMAELTCAKLQTAANWLYERDAIASAHPTPSRWKEKLKGDWQDIHELRTEPRPTRPRHSPQEIEKLHQHLDEADPRLQLAFALGAEFRMGQVVRSNRSDLDLAEDAGVGHGTFRIHGRKRKQGELVFLTPEQRALVDKALGPGGHLSAFESACRAGERDDYPLFPGGRMRQGQCVPREPQKRMRIETLRGYFRDLEEAAGVEHIEGRGFYGVRRGSTDAVSAHTTDEEVRDRSGGWSDGSGARGNGIRSKGTRRTVYRNADDPRPRARAAEVRRRIRGGAQPAHGPGDTGPADETGDRGAAALAAPLEAAGLSADQLERLAEVPEEKLAAVLRLLEL